MVICRFPKLQKCLGTGIAQSLQVGMTVLKALAGGHDHLAGRHDPLAGGHDHFAGGHGHFGRWA